MAKIATTAERLRTLYALGPANLGRVGLYRLLLRFGVHPVQRLLVTAPQGPFYRGDRTPMRPNVIANSSWQSESEVFSTHRFALSGAPDWHANPWRPGVRADARSPWWQIVDFNPDLGDIKAIWEASRFDWLVAMAQRASLGSRDEFDRLNGWLSDWVASNPPYLGANWKCGQEASIRVMHLATAAIILGETREPTRGMVELIRLHLARIAPTMGYAIGQQNNHGTSEAAALFIGGSWLRATGDAAGQRAEDLGRRWLEERARRLIMRDGTFSQYSVVYHRLMLDTFSLAEAWRRMHDLPAFSAALHERLQAATLWLRNLVDPMTGDAPNLGANDGARLLPLGPGAYRDFRASVQRAARLFCNARAYGDGGPWDQGLHWLDLAPASGDLPERKSCSFDDGGLHALHVGRAAAYMRYPRFQFRPSQADALHVDFWIDGENILRDAGTYSYAETHARAGDLGAAAAHNTVTFDGRDQMPRLSRFLYGAWLDADDVALVSESDERVSAAAGYRDHAGAAHHRTVTLAPGRLTCIDRVSGAARSATLRWRLKPDEWLVSGNAVEAGGLRLAVASDRPVRRFALTSGFEARHYLDLAPVPVLEVDVEVPATLETTLTF